MDNVMLVERGETHCTSAQSSPNVVRRTLPHKLSPNVDRKPNGADARKSAKNVTDAK